MKKNVLRVLILLFSGPAVLLAAPQEQDLNPIPDIVATVLDGSITRESVEEAVAADLEQVDLDSLRFAASQDQRRHEIVAGKVHQMIAEKLVSREAETEGVSEDELLGREVFSKTEQPTEEEVTEFYQMNQSRMQGSQAQMMPLIGQYLYEQKQAQSYRQYVEVLKEKHSVVVFISPFRMELDTEGHPSTGPADAPITLVEFSDFECPYCQDLFGTIKDLREEYGEKLRIVFRQFPLNDIHPRAQKAAEASLCANEHGKFWEMHDLMFEDQAALEIPQLTDKAETLGLDPEGFRECLDSAKHASRIKADVTAGATVGVAGTPAIFVNGRPLVGNVPYEEVARLIDDELTRSASE